jgi:hypothetical protein
MHDLKELFKVATEDEVAKLFGKSKESLANDRCRGVGPRYVKAGKKVLYPIDGLREYLEAQTVTHEPAPTLIHESKSSRGRSRLKKAA